MGNLILLIGLGLFVSCGKSLQAAKLPPLIKEESLAISPEELDGEIETSTGLIIPVNTLRTRPLVLVFASDSCATCTLEARTFAAHLAAMEAKDLANVDYYTVLIGAYPEDLAAWVLRLMVSWTAGTQDGDSMFEKFCKERLTPCVITYDPAFRRFTKFVGETPITKLQQQTGSWSYIPKEQQQ